MYPPNPRSEEKKKEGMMRVQKNHSELSDSKKSKTTKKSRDEGSYKEKEKKLFQPAQHLLLASSHQSSQPLQAKGRKGSDEATS